MTYYKKYCDELINCPFCDKLQNVYYIKKHLKNRKCQLHQESNKDNVKNIIDNLDKEINKIKSSVKYNL